MLYPIRRMLELICLILALSAGCMLFKKNTKTTMENNLETNHKTYLERVNLKTASKETNIYTYWNDSSVFQYQNIRENIEEAKRSTVNTDEKQVMQQRETMKKTEPPDLWVYGVVIIIGIGILIFVVKFWRKR
ncbi:hypothetical protein SAMN04488101_1187 [Pedobacter nyackensis]|uniref:Lipoprotein n=2 Tax=Pedobacter nyackensis TaxID=475255 RepID=A0A1W2EZE5_9SPHI|nr:hypothetical protein SAMN04488101_1187 [Pedobacter nyackensis]